MVFAERKDLGKWVLVSMPNGLKVFTGAVLISSRIALGGAGSLIIFSALVSNFLAFRTIALIQASLSISALLKLYRAAFKDAHINGAHAG